MSKNQSKINSSRTLEIFQSGQGADFVIEVMQQQTDGQDQANKVSILFGFSSVVPLDLIFPC
jgi:hypothetical protein